MAAVDPALLARAKAQIEADPRFAALANSRGRAQGGGAIDPRLFGVDYLPPGYVYSLGSRQVVNEHDYADWVIPAIAAAGGGITAATGAFGAANAIPQLGNVNSTVDSLMAGGAAKTGIAALGTKAGLARAATSGLPAILSAARSFGGGGGGPFGEDSAGLVNEIRESIGAQRKRFDETQPAFETSQRMALGMAPTRYRSSGPFGGPR